MNKLRFTIISFVAFAIFFSGCERDLETVSNNKITQEQALNYLTNYHAELEASLQGVELPTPENIVIPNDTEEVVNPNLKSAAFTAGFWIDAALGYIVGEAVGKITGISDDASESVQDYTLDIPEETLNRLKIKDGDAKMVSAESFILNRQYSQAATKLVEALGDYIESLPHSAAHIMPVLVLMEKNYTHMAINTKGKSKGKYNYGLLQKYNVWTHNQYRLVLKKYNEKLNSATKASNLTNYNTFNKILKNNGSSGSNWVKAISGKAQIWKSGRKFPPRGKLIGIHHVKMSEDGFLITVNHGSHSASNKFYHTWFRIWNNTKNNNRYGIYYTVNKSKRRFLRLAPDVSWGENYYYAWGELKPKNTKLKTADYRWQFIPYGDNYYIISTVNSGGKSLYPLGDGLVGSVPGPIKTTDDVGKFQLVLYKSGKFIK